MILLPVLASWAIGAWPVGVVALAIAACGLAASTPWRWRLLDAPLVLACAIGLAQVAWGGSAQPARTLLAVGGWGAVLLTFWASRGWLAHGDLEAPVWLLLGLLGAAVVATVIARWAGLMPAWDPGHGLLPAFIAANDAAAWAVLVGALACGVSRDWPARLVVFTVVGIALAVTHSRSGLVMASIVLAVGARRAWGIGLAAAGIALSVGMKASGLSGRGAIWLDDARVMMTAPWIGHGLGAWPPGALSNYAHNAYGQVAIEGGAALVVCLVCAGLLMIDDAVLLRSTPPRRWAGAGLVGLAVQSVVESSVCRPAVAVLAALCVAILVAPVQADEGGVGYLSWQTPCTLVSTRGPATVTIEVAENPLGNTVTFESTLDVDPLSRLAAWDKLPLVRFDREESATNVVGVWRARVYAAWVRACNTSLIGAVKTRILVAP